MVLISSKIATAGQLVASVRHLILYFRVPKTGVLASIFYALRTIFMASLTRALYVKHCTFIQKTGKILRGSHPSVFKPEVTFKLFCRNANYIFCAHLKLINNEKQY
jgi:hypothetical protein